MKSVPRQHVYDFAPLNAIIGFSEVLRDADMTSRSSAASSAISQRQHLLSLINDIPDLSRK